MYNYSVLYFLVSCDVPLLTCLLTEICPSILDNIFRFLFQVIGNLAQCVSTHLSLDLFICLRQDDNFLRRNWILGHSPSLLYITDESKVDPDLEFRNWELFVLLVPRNLEFGKCLLLFQNKKKNFIELMVSWLYHQYHVAGLPCSYLKIHLTLCILHQWDHGREPVY